MVSAAFVNMWNKRVGAISWDSSTGTGYFEFDPAFLKLNLEISPLKIFAAGSAGKIFSFPELRNIPSFRGLPGLLADILPDRYGNALINTWLARRGRPANSLNPVEILCFTGKRGMGTLEIEPAFPEGPDKAEKIEIDELVKIADDILTGRKDFSVKLPDNEEKAMLDILKMGSSPAGARAKVLVAFNPKTVEVRSGQTDVPRGFSHWLLKFDGVTDSQFGSTSGYGRVELAYYLMAKDAGIEMNECRLLEENGRAHFMTRRFDREQGNKKVHMQSFFAIQHYDFNDITLYSYEMLFETMRLLRLPYPQAEQLFRRMVFNVLARICDDHTKNFAFLMNEDGLWRLSPAYDICHSYRPESLWVSQQSLSVNGKRKNINRDDLISVAKQMNIKKASGIINEINRIVTDWNSYAEQTKVLSPLRDSIDKTLIKL
ncbi:MAG: type II toxin-antitoxin system HipA family toxin [Bacteroidia bacterium]|nr:type II toxin-antitoxin system HipA family toxin [Bacteroidia bacterium]